MSLLFGGTALAGAIIIALWIIKVVLNEITQDK